MTDGHAGVSGGLAEDFRVMGVVNVTPDSFSDGGLFLDPSAAVAHGLRLEREGAAILDVGGEVIQPAAEGDTVWFVAGADPDAEPAPGYLIQLRADDTVATRIALPAGFVSGGAAVAFGSVWVSDFAHPQLIRVPQP